MFNLTLRFKFIIFKFYQLIKLFFQFFSIIILLYMKYSIIILKGDLINLLENIESLPSFIAAD